MDRRALLKTGGVAALGLGLGGCALRTGGAGQRPMVNLAPVDASWDRVIRTTVGLRPHRPSGFVLRAEKLDAKAVIHNYGHGGGGLSLSWGTGALAVDLALEHDARNAAVLGSGAVGLATAKQLQMHGFDVTIYTMALPPDTTSNKAWGSFDPLSGLLSDDPTPEWSAQFRSAAEIAYTHLQLMAGRNSGVSWIDSYSTLENLPTRGESDDREGSGLFPAHLRTGSEILYPGEHPFPTRYATRRPSIRIEPSIYLDAMLTEFLRFDGKVVIRKFDNPRDLMTLNEPLIVNCTGLGSRDLFSDEELMPVKGQLTFLVPQTEVDYRYGSAMPRSDGIALGYTGERGVWSMEPDEEARRRNVERAIELFSAMRRPDPGVPLATSKGPATVPSVESFFGDGS